MSVGGVTSLFYLGIVLTVTFIISQVTDSSKHPRLTTIVFAQLFIAVICFGFQKLIAQLDKPKFSDYVREPS